jgi:thiamine-monophosphate kinase
LVHDRNISERELIRRIRGLTDNGSHEAIMGIGDDCAVLRGHGNSVWLITTDTLVESVHFDLAWHPPRQLGRKAANVNISDIAAMGGRAIAALLAIAVPDSEIDWLDEFLAGFVEALKEQGAELVGGDTVKSRDGTVFNVTIVGTMEGPDILYRRGAQPGDLIWISGPVGEAAAGLALLKAGAAGQAAVENKWQHLVKAHVDPEPQIVIGRHLARSGLVSAMIDVSDGLATDLAHICEASGVAAVIRATDLPVSEELAAAAGYLGCSPLEWMLRGGEDYQLLFTAPADREAAIRNLIGDKTGRTIYSVGRIEAGAGVLLHLPDGRRMDVTYQGYDHFSSGRNQSD